MLAVASSFLGNGVLKPVLSLSNATFQKPSSGVYTNADSQSPGSSLTTIASCSYTVPNVNHFEELGKQQRDQANGRAKTAVPPHDHLMFAQLTETINFSSLDVASVEISSSSARA